MRIDITAQDIRRGRKLDPEACAAAQSILRSTGAKAVRVHRGNTYLLMGEEWVRFATSAGLRMETIIFDRGGQFMPGEYDLRPVPTSQIFPGTQTQKRAPRSKSPVHRRTTIPGVRRSVYQRKETDDE
jgi:hypothetical protein